MTDYQHPGKTSTGQYYAEPTFKLLDVMKQKHWRKLSPRSLTFSWQCTSAQVTGCSASLCDCKFVQLNHSTYSPDLAPSDHLLTRNLPSSWNLVHRWRNHRQSSSRHGVRVKTKKLYFQGINSWEGMLKKMHWCCRRICRKMTVYMT